MKLTIHWNNLFFSVLILLTFAQITITADAIHNESQLKAAEDRATKHYLGGRG